MCARLVEQHLGQEREREPQHAAAEGDHEMTKLLLKPLGAEVFDVREPGADRYAGTGERGPQQHLDEWVHRVTNRGTGSAQAEREGCG